MEWFFLAVAAATGVSLGYMWGRAAAAAEMAELTEKANRLAQDLHRVTDRDSRGRFTRS